MQNYFSYWEILMINLSIQEILIVFMRVATAETYNMSASHTYFRFNNKEMKKKSNEHHIRL